MSLFKLFLLFLKIGAVLLGGGYVILPIMTEELITKRNLVTHDDLMDYFALSQSLPGLIAINLSLFVGYKLKGKIGALFAVTGVVFIPILCIILLGSILDLIAENLFLQGAFKGIAVAVIALIILNIREIWQNTNKHTFYYFIFCISLIFLQIFNYSPIKTIVICGTLGMVIKIIQKKFFNNKENK